MTNSTGPDADLQAVESVSLLGEHDGVLDDDVLDLLTETENENGGPGGRRWSFMPPRAGQGPGAV